MTSHPVAGVDVPGRSGQATARVLKRGARCPPLPGQRSTSRTDAPANQRPGGWLPAGQRRDSGTGTGPHQAPGYRPGSSGLAAAGQSHSGRQQNDKRYYPHEILPLYIAMIPLQRSEIMTKIRQFQGA